MRQLSFQ